MTEWYEQGERDARILRNVKETGSAVRVLERKVESLLKRLVERYGGRCFKFVSPSNPGVPDRIVVFRGWLYLVELKTIGGTLTKSQKALFPIIRAMGTPIYELYTTGEVENWIDGLLLDQHKGTLTWKNYISRPTATNEGEYADYIQSLERAYFGAWVPGRP